MDREDRTPERTRSGREGHGTHDPAAAREELSTEAPTEASVGELPDTRLFWRWAARATRPIAGWVLIALGGLAILVGWYGISGESLVAKQLPYLVSGGITGMVLVGVGAFFLGTEDLRKQLQRLDRIERQVDELHAVLLVRADAPERGRSANGSPRARARERASGQLVALRSGTSYHRPECQMVAGKDHVRRVTADAVERRRLEPCALCDPEPATA